MKNFEIHIDEDLMDIMPSFISLTQRDMDDLSVAVGAGEWETVKKIAHTLKGDSGGYGFDEMSEIARKLEKSSEAKEEAVAEEAYEDLKIYWDQVLEKYQEVSKAV